MWASVSAWPTSRTEVQPPAGWSKRSRRSSCSSRSLAMASLRVDPSRSARGMPRRTRERLSRS